MKRILTPYYLFALLATSVAMIFLLKINKQSFYHHYFRVIEDVEARNSQHLQDLPTLLASLEATTELSHFSLTEWISWVLVGLVGVSLIVLPILVSTVRFSVPSLWPLPFYLRQPIPIRAP